MPEDVDDSRDDPLDDDLDDEEEADQGAFVCPGCCGPVHEETQKCPHCGDWITPVERKRGGKRWVLLLAVGLMILLMLLITIL